MSKSIRIIFVCILFSHAAEFKLAQTAQQDYDKRAPFEIELPEVSLLRQKGERVEILHTPEFPTQPSLRTIKLWVLNPWAQTFESAKIKTYINRNGANIAIKSKGAVKDGMVIELDLSYLKNFRLLPDKNVIEITAADKTGREYSASFVLLSGGKTTANTFTGRKLAVIIGVSDYLHNDDRLGDLNFADDDARAIRDFLRTPAGGGFAEEDMELLIDEKATLSTVRDRLRRFLSKADPQDLIYLFLAGHGFPDIYTQKRDDYFFALHDSKLADLPNTALRMTDLRRILESQKGERIIAFIDTCHSAGIDSAIGSKKGRQTLSEPSANATGRGQSVRNNTRPVQPSSVADIQVKPSSLTVLANGNFREKGWAILTSSDVRESSFEDARWENHGLFTYAILQGVKGGADADADGTVTTGELFSFVQKFVVKASNGRQTPQAHLQNEKIVLSAAPKPAARK